MPYFDMIPLTNPGLFLLAVTLGAIALARIIL